MIAPQYKHEHTSILHVRCQANFSLSAIPGYDLVLPRCQLVMSGGAGVRLRYMYWMTSILVSGSERVREHIWMLVAPAFVASKACNSIFVSVSSCSLPMCPVRSFSNAETKHKFAGMTWSIFFARYTVNSIIIFVWATSFIGGNLQCLSCRKCGKTPLSPNFSCFHVSAAML